MSDNTPKNIENGDVQTKGRALDRREFLGATAASLVVGAGLLACDDTQAQEPAKAEAPAEAAPVKEAPEATKEAPKAEEAAGADKQKKTAEADAANAEPVQEKAFPFKKDGFIVQVSHDEATSKIKRTNEELVEKMVHEALVKLTGEKDAKAAMGRFITKADIEKDPKRDMVGIKVNCLGSPYAAVHPATAFSLARLVAEQGIPKEKIVIYDQYGSRMAKAGFRIQAKGRTKPMDKNDGFQVQNHGTMGYESTRTEVGGFNKNNKKPFPAQLPKLMRRLAVVINVCVPKDHDLTGITGALKNVSYGNVERVPIYHCAPSCNPTCQHEGLCNVSRIYKHEMMGGVVRLVVCDALRVLFQGGPQDNMTFKAAHNAILASTDPVSIDRAIHTIVNEYRATRKLKPVEEDQNGRRAPRHIDAAAKLGLGVADMAKIKWDKHKMA